MVSDPQIWVWVSKLYIRAIVEWKQTLKSELICILKSPCYASWLCFLNGFFSFYYIMRLLCSCKRSAKLQSPISMSKGVTHLDTTCLATSLAHFQAMSSFLTAYYHLLTRAISARGTSLSWRVWVTCHSNQSKLEGGLKETGLKTKTMYSMRKTIYLFF